MRKSLSLRSLEGLVLLDWSEDGIATITLNQPDRANALNQAMLSRLQQILLAIHHARIADEQILSGIVLCGNGAHYCTGGDVHELKRALRKPGTTLPQLSASNYAIGQVVSLIRQLDVPVATVPHGKTVGGGHILTMVGDVRIGVSGGTFSFGNISRGVTPVGGLCRMMTSAVGETAALNYYFRDAVDTDGPLDTEQALVRGVLTHTVGTSEEGRALAMRLLRDDDGAPGMKKRCELDLTHAAVAESVSFSRCVMGGGGNLDLSTDSRSFQLGEHGKLLRLKSEDELAQRAALVRIRSCAVSDQGGTTPLDCGRVVSVAGVVVRAGADASFRVGDRVHGKTTAADLTSPDVHSGKMAADNTRE